MLLDLHASLAADTIRRRPHARAGHPTMRPPLCKTVALLPFMPVLLMLAVMLGGMRCDPARWRWRTALADLVRLEMSVERFRLNCGRLPHALDELIGLLDHDECDSRSVAPLSKLKDPWGNCFVYWRSPDGRRFEVRAVGRDGVYGSRDDVVKNGWQWPWPEPYWRSWIPDRRMAEFFLRLALVCVVVGWPLSAVVGWICRTGRQVRAGSGDVRRGAGPHQ
jgi:hypothetical protein